MNDEYLWDRSGAPDPEIETLERMLAPHRYRRRRPRWPLLVTAAAAAIALAVVLWPSGDRAAWQVEWLAGAGDAQLAVGDVLRTTGDARARIAVADIGHVDIAPGSTVRFVGTSEKEHRLALDRGRLDAVVYAPPRLFVVDTPSATAVDLGCAYSLEVDENGDGVLHVVSGYVELEAGDGFPSFVPAGASCRFAKGRGPGLPFREGVPETLLDPEASTAQFTDALSRARMRDVLTLLHLLPRVDGARREEIYRRAEKLAPPPQGVTCSPAFAVTPQAIREWCRSLPRG